MRAAVVAMLLWATSVAAHDGPPFPIVSDRAAGAYVISIWSDPDATDDGSAGGQFWVTIEPLQTPLALPPGTRARLSLRPLSRAGEEQTAAAEPVRGDVTNQFAALVMDHEGPFAVHLSVEGPLGTATVSASVEATYDLRPPAYMVLWYLMPFLAVGILWARLLVRRRLGSSSTSRIQLASSGFDPRRRPPLTRAGLRKAEPAAESQGLGLRGRQNAENVPGDAPLDNLLNKVYRSIV